MNRLRDNWARSWRLGRVEFEIEWVPKGRYYVFSLTINSPGPISTKEES